MGIPDFALTDSHVLPFVVIPVGLVLALACGAALASRRSGAPQSANRTVILTVALAALWMALTWIAAARGVFVDFQRTPPPFAILVLFIIVIAAAIAFSPFGGRLARYVPLWMLIAVQGFRLPLELAMHGLYERGIMPLQMTYTGRNFDIVTGTTAIVVAALIWSGRAGRPLAAAWNLLGLALLTNIVAVAILSTPRFAYFGQDRLNVFVLYPPFVWLPAVMVLAALAGHLVIARALRTGQRLR